MKKVIDFEDFWPEENKAEVPSTTEASDPEPQTPPPPPTRRKQAASEYPLTFEVNGVKVSDPSGLCNYDILVEGYLVGEMEGNPSYILCYTNKPFVLEIADSSNGLVDKGNVFMNFSNPINPFDLKAVKNKAYAPLESGAESNESEYQPYFYRGRKKSGGTLTLGGYGPGEYAPWRGGGGGGWGVR